MANNCTIYWRGMKGEISRCRIKKNKHLYYVILSNGKGIELLIRKLINVYKKKMDIEKKISPREANFAFN